METPKGRPHEPSGLEPERAPAPPVPAPLRHPVPRGEVAELSGRSVGVHVGSGGDGWQGESDSCQLSVGGCSKNNFLVLSRRGVFFFKIESQQGRSTTPKEHILEYKYDSAGILFAHKAVSDSAGILFFIRRCCSWHPFCSHGGVCRGLRLCLDGAGEHGGRFLERIIQSGEAIDIILATGNPALNEKHSNITGRTPRELRHERRNLTGFSQFSVGVHCVCWDKNSPDKSAPI